MILVSQATQSHPTLKIAILECCLTAKPCCPWEVKRAVSQLTNNSASVPFLRTPVGRDSPERKFSKCGWSLNSSIRTIWDKLELCQPHCRPAEVTTAGGSLAIGHFTITTAQPSDLILKEMFLESHMEQPLLFIFLSQSTSPSQYMPQVLSVKYWGSNPFQASITFHKLTPRLFYLLGYIVSGEMRGLGREKCSFLFSWGLETFFKDLF